MKFSYLWLKDIVGFKETPEKLGELLTLRSFEIESIEKVGNDYTLDIKITANRLTDAGGHMGLAREIAAVTNTPFREQNVKAPSVVKKFPIDIDIIPSELCSRYSAQLIAIPKTMQSPRWLQDRLITCGLRPINVVVDVTNYVMLETGHPLHAFDADKIIGNQMLVRESKKDEKVTTLDGVERLLPDGVIIIQDRDRIIDCAGIMGAENSAMSAETEKILLQAAVFDPVRMYRASRLLGLASAASKLYAAGVDYSSSLLVLERATELLEEIFHAKRLGGAYDWYPEKAKSSKILFCPDYADSIIGHVNGMVFYQRVFARLGFIFKKQGDNLIVEVPPRRRDIQIEEDLIEEAARLFGYENIEARFPDISLSPGPQNDEIFWRDAILDHLAFAGFTESECYEFTGGQELAQFAYEGLKPVELANPISADQRFLAPRILIKYISSVKENLVSHSAVKLFGFGKSFISSSQGMEERKDLIIALSRKGTKGEDEFYELKGAVDSMLETLGIEEWSYRETKEADKRREFAIFHPYRAAEIIADGNVIGMIGEIHPVICENIKAKARIAAAEIYFDPLWKLACSEQQYRPVGKYPAVRRDIALVVPFNTKTQDIVNVMEIAGGQLLIDTDLFDYFQDDMMQEAENKSLAFHLVFESPERTLKDEEVERLVTSIIQALEENNWEVRK
ncbi:MAG: phenylalanine--tRNA ligase subunit beta [bacterium]|nr:phenylalanine--tRNA ligase subunit beta [bacterium]MDZ4286282.1 phenylalanine--tRNA ligase subunit beta [Candidatus Sungbacteria bacterium]